MHQRDAIRDAVMQAADQGAAAAVFLHQVHLPERVLEIQLCAHQLADQCLQAGLPGDDGAADPPQVVGDVEIGVFFPVIRARRQPAFHRSLVEAVVDQQALLDHLFQAFMAHAFGEDHHPRDHHQVIRLFHAQPGSIHVR